MTDLRTNWLRFIDSCAALRPELFRYCRSLTRNPWDAEDLVQDVLAITFATTAKLTHELPNPRAWMFRVATNRWLNEVAQRRRAPPSPMSAHHRDPQQAREAVGTLLSQLSPQERAAVALKDMFGFTLEEVADALSTSVGAVKSALHRGREKLVEPEPRRDEVPTSQVIEAFCRAMNARDVDALTTMLLNDALVESPGVAFEIGAEAARNGTLTGLVLGCEDSVTGTTPLRAEVRSWRDEAIILCWRNELVHEVLRFELEGEKVRALRVYLHTPELIAEVCTELGVTPRLYGYH
ncbi:MAG: RNA polymerase sigma factor [Archangium sp.]